MNVSKMLSICVVLEPVDDLRPAAVLGLLEQQTSAAGGTRPDRGVRRQL